MIELTKNIFMTADDHCYIVGTPRQREGRSLEIRNPKYYSTAAQAVRGALNLAMRDSVADGSVTTLREFIERQTELQAEFERMIAPLE